MNIYKPCGIISGRELHYYLHLLCLTVGPNFICRYAQFAHIAILHLHIITFV